MGRPKGDGARSKSRPSSSSLAAASLAQTSRAVSVGFGGYVGSSRIDSGPAGEDAYLNFDGESAANLRKLSKKDTTTKLKALAALSSSFQGQSAAELGPLVPSWAFEYKRLLQDNSRQIREATNKAMTILAIAIGRSIAPHLKVLMGPLWIAHFDPSPEGSESARQSFQAIFSDQKRRLEALLFFAGDVLNHIDENLKLTPQTIGEKNTPLDELTEKYERVISSSLLALASLIDVLVTSAMADGEEAGNKNGGSKLGSVRSSAVKIFEDHKQFQVFFKSTSPNIRSAVYQCTKFYIQHLPDAITLENIDVVRKSVLGAFAEKDPGCHQAMWDMVLLFSRDVRAWEGSTPRKLVYPRFWSFLRHGCFGSQKTSYPCILPFLSLIPATSVAPAEGFFNDFFANLWRSCQDGIWTYEDGELLLRTVKECFQWVIAHAYRYNNAEAATFQVSITEAVLLRLLWRSYVSEDSPEKVQQGSYLLRSEQFIEAVGNCILDMVKSLDDFLLSTFWALFRESCTSLLQRAENEEFLSRMAQFFVLLSKWPKGDVLNNLVKPFIVEAFPLIKAAARPGMVRLLSQIVSTYGSRAFVLLASSYWAGPNDSREQGSDSLTDIFGLKQLEYFFRKELVPWCLEGEVDELKLELLLSFLEDATFFKDWNLVLTTISELQCEKLKKTTILAKLLIKLQSRCVLRHEASSLLNWRSSLIDEAVLAIAKNADIWESSAYNLIQSCLTGVQVNGTFYLILSANTVTELLQSILDSIIPAATLSPCHLTPFLISSFTPDQSEQFIAPSTPPYEAARSAIGLLLAVYPSVRVLEPCSTILAKMFATITCLYWGYMRTVVMPGYENADDDNDHGEVLVLGGGEKEAAFIECLLSARQEMLSMSADMNPLQCSSVQELLTTSVRKAILEAEGSELHKVAAAWVVDLLTFAKDDRLQIVLDLLLAPAKCWPIYSSAAKRMIEERGRHDIFISAVHKIGLRIGLEQLVLGSMRMSEKESRSNFSRPWLVIEMLCTWRWSTGSAEDYILPFLKSLTAGTELLDTVVAKLFLESRSRADGANIRLYACWRSNLECLEEYFRGLLSLLGVVCGDSGPFSKPDSAKLFQEYLASSSGAPLWILPCVLDILMPSLRKKSTNEHFFEGADIESTTCDWLQTALKTPPSDPTERTKWMLVAASCFPVDLNGGSTALLRAAGAEVSEKEKGYLLHLLNSADIPPAGADRRSTSDQLLQLGLARLAAAAVCYCWRSFNTELWTFIIGQLRKWLQEAVVEAEELTESIAEMTSDEAFENMKAEDRDIRMEILGAGVNILSMMKALHCIDEGSESPSLQSLEEAKWEDFEARAAENVLRILLATGLAESFGDAAREGVSLYRSRHPQVWDQIASIALGANDRVREAAIRAADLWGLGKGGITALYSLLFSPNPVASLQWVAYKFLSIDPLQSRAITWKISGPTPAEDDETPSSEDISDIVRPELRIVLETPAKLLLGTPLTSSLRVHYFLAWSLFLNYLQTLPSASQTRERLLQYAQDSNTPGTLLDCLFQHIALKKLAGSGSNKRKDVIDAPALGDAARRSAETGSISFAVEGLWGGGKDEIAALAGALYSLSLRVIPACVRTWYTGFRDRGYAGAIELFTSLYCTPALLEQEFQQVQAAGIADETLVIKSNKAQQEVTASYKKEESGMDIVIKLPSCYPLKAVELNCTRRLGISETLLRKWSLSMAAFLRNQNGAVAQAVIIWKRNIDREFEGVEECPICYSIIHTSDHTLPRLACKTCRHKFHSACLYKWFSSSHKSTCPLCKTPF